MRKPKVLLLLHDLTLTGSPKVALDAFEALKDRVSLRMVCPQGGPLEERCRQIGPLQLLRVPTPPKPLPRPSRQIVASLVSLSMQRWQPDLIYANSLGSLLLAATLRLPLTPVLLHLHELELSFAEDWDKYKRFLRWPQRFIAVSDPVRTMLIDTFGIPNEQISVIHEFVRDEDFAAVSEGKSRQETLDAPFIVGGAGKPSWRKGTTLWLQTAVEMKKLMGRRPFKFVWVGVRDNFESHAFQVEARKHGVQDLVQFIPATTEPLPYYKGFDVFAMTSWEDPCPVVVLENMMLGKPVACFAGSGGAPEVVGGTGPVVENFSPVALACALTDLAENPARRDALGQAARARVGQNFTALVQVPKIWREIESAVAEGRVLARPFPRGAQG